MPSGHLLRCSVLQLHSTTSQEMIKVSRRERSEHLRQVLGKVGANFKALALFWQLVQTSSTDTHSGFRRGQR